MNKEFDYGVRRYCDKCGIYLNDEDIVHNDAVKQYAPDAPDICLDCFDTYLKDE